VVVPCPCCLQLGEQQEQEQEQEQQPSELDCIQQQQHRQNGTVIVIGQKAKKETKLNSYDVNVHVRIKSWTQNVLQLQSHIDVVFFRTTKLDSLQLRK
jgi:GTP cyclohydrolase FolE2